MRRPARLIRGLVATSPALAFAALSLAASAQTPPVTTPTPAPAAPATPPATTSADPTLPTLPPAAGPSSTSTGTVQGGGTVGAGAGTGSFGAAGTGTAAPGPSGSAPGSGSPTTEPPPPGRPDDSLMTGTAGARSAGLAPPGTGGHSFIDTRLTWTFGDDDFLNKTGVIVPVSPGFSIGDRPQYRMFFDNLNSRFAGRENLTHLVMYTKAPGFFPNLTTEAALVLRFDLSALSSQTGNLNSALYDSGSYIRAFYKVGEVVGADGKPKDMGLSAVFFPLDTDRMRLGYLYDISWGGTDARINESIFPRIQGSSPGLKLQFDMPDRFYAFVGFKTATIVQPVQVLNPGSESDVEVVRVGETNYGGLTGAGVDVHQNVRFDVGAGYFQQGKFDLEDVRGKSVYTYGASGRIVVHHQMPVPQSVDFRLYRNDPSAPMILFAPVKYNPGEVAWSASLEGSALEQHLKDFDRSGEVKNQLAKAAALQAVVTAGYARFSATGIYRDLNFVVRNVPGFIPFETLPDNTKTDPELFGAASASYHLPGPRLTPEIAGGVQMPSTFRSIFSDGGVPASRTIVVRRQGDESILPYGQDRRAILQARLSVRWDLSNILAMVGWGQLVSDNNGTLVVRDPQEGTASLRIYQKPTRLGAGLALQARF